MLPELYTIRSARPADLAALPAIERAAAALFQTTSYPEMADAPLASSELHLDQDYIWVVVDANNAPIGFAIVHVLKESVHLHELDVHPKYARQGLGRRLIATIAEWARNRGACALTLTTFADIAWNGPYYTRLGFRTLEVSTLNREQLAIRQDETNIGLPMAQRICMQLDL